MKLAKNRSSTSVESARVRVFDARTERWAEGSIEIVRWERAARLRRGAKAFGACLGLAVVAVFIPILHFVLVPGLILASPLVAAAVFNRTEKITGGTADCPGCGKKLPIVGGRFRFPKSDLCQACLTEVRVELS